jgi:ribosomal protein S18 acetylase RimI-like enzyme
MSKPEIQFLEGIDFSRIHQAFLKAFSDYIVPMQLTVDQFLEMMTRRGANFPLSVGAFVDGELAAFNINALETFGGIPTVYDVVTGVIPSQRRKGIATSLFEFSLPRLRQTNALRYVLEVIATNQPAFATYQRIGFQIIRGLQAFNRKMLVQPSRQPADELSFQQIELNWQQIKDFWDWEPSWQNSIASMTRSRAKKITLGAFVDKKLVGYGIVYPGTGDIPQFAVERSYRCRGIGTHLIHALQKAMITISPARVVNVDVRAASTLTFLKGIGFDALTSQHEMELKFPKD